ATRHGRACTRRANLQADGVPGGPETCSSTNREGGRAPPGRAARRAAALPCLFLGAGRDQKIGRAPLETGHGWPAGSIGSPQRGHSGRPAVSTVSACFEKATTWSWLSQKRTLGASSSWGASSAPAAAWLATRTNIRRASW